jgi:hypothetical protein
MVLLPDEAREELFRFNVNQESKAPALIVIAAELAALDPSTVYDQRSMLQRTNDSFRRLRGLAPVVSRPIKPSPTT